MLHQSFSPCKKRLIHLQILHSAFCFFNSQFSILNLIWSGYPLQVLARLRLVAGFPLLSSRVAPPAASLKGSRFAPPKRSAKETQALRDAPTRVSGEGSPKACRKTKAPGVCGLDMT
jgi:hypothetical protein